MIHHTRLKNNQLINFINPFLKLVLILMVLILVGCTKSTSIATQVSTQTPDIFETYCTDQGYTITTIKTEDGNNARICVFSDESTCELEAYYRGECAPGLGPPPALDWSFMHKKIIDYLLTYYSQLAPEADLVWVQGETKSQNGEIIYYGGDWLVAFSEIVTSGGYAIVNVVVHNQANDFLWTGSIDADGQILEETVLIPTSTVLVIATATQTPIPTPTTIPATPTPVCNLGTGLIPSLNGRGLVGTATNLLNVPSNSPDTPVIAKISDGIIFDVIDGPICAEGLNWWFVQVGSLVGWMAEEGQNFYWLDPYQIIIGQSVDGWIGTIISLVDNNMVTDCFTYFDQPNSCYGIIGNTIQIESTIELLRDTQTTVVLFGILLPDPTDVSQQRIQVDQLEIINR